MKVCTLVAGLAAAFAMTAAFAQPPTAIKFSHVTTADTPKGKEEVEALQMGAVQVLAPAPVKFGPMVGRDLLQSIYKETKFNPDAL